MVGNLRFGHDRIRIFGVGQVKYRLAEPCIPLSTLGAVFVNQAPAKERTWPTQDQTFTHGCGARGGLTEQVRAFTGTKTMLYRRDVDTGVVHTESGRWGAIHHGVDCV